MVSMPSRSSASPKHLSFKSGDGVNARVNEGVRRFGQFGEFEACGPSLLKCCGRRSWKAGKCFDFVKFAEVHGDGFANCLFERVGIDRLEKSARQPCSYVLDRKCLQSVLALDRCHSANLTP
jgi:hypothetical protein